jgi:hypothetical protein
MCDTYIEDIGYICYECKREFRDEFEQFENSWGSTITENVIKGQLETFMKTKKPGNTDPVTLDEFFEKRSR